jgi:predicted HTH transcriptional regulator
MRDADVRPPNRNPKPYPDVSAELLAQLAQGPQTTRQLADATGRGRETVAYALTKLVRDRRVREIGAGKPGVSKSWERS